MKTYVYPAILYLDQESGGYTITIPDVGIVTEGDSVEDAFLRAKSFLEAFAQLVERLDCEEIVPTDFKSTYLANPKNIVLLVDSEIE